MDHRCRWGKHIDAFTNLGLDVDDDCVPTIAEESKRIRGRCELEEVSDVLEKKREFLITADLPGLSKDVVNVTVDDERRLHITAERAERHEEKVGEDDEDVKMHVYERTYGKVERMFKLPENVEDEKIEADMKNGVLSVHIPKQPEPAKEQIPERAIKIK